MYALPINYWRGGGSAASSRGTTATSGRDHGCCVRTA
eukprot:COSAG01_NODE_63416_length_280_cov_0.574586_1_plen_36_part_10